MSRATARRANDLFVSSWLALALTACSADVGSIFDRGATGGSAGEGGEAQGASSHQGGSSDGGTTNPGPSTNPSTSPSTSTNPDATTNDATVTSTQDSSTTGPPPGPAVDCGGSPCSVAGDGLCCYDDATGDTDCVGSSAECPVGFGNQLVALSCQVPDDCPTNQICCARREYSSGQAPYDRTECVASCNYPDLYLCDINAPDCPTYQGPTGPIQSTCKQSQLLPVGYYVCGLNN